MPQSTLAGVYLFKNMGPEELNQISKICVIDNLQQGHTVFQENDEAHALYIVKYGTLRLSHTSETGEVVDFATLGTGDHFGEMSFIDGKRRNAKAVTIENSQVVRIDYAQLKKLLDAQPLIGARFYKAISQSLSARLNMTTHDLSFARERNMRHHG